ncbi:hypothetical protein J6590_057834 [Homalodisca vitripennis]|nr:hypothetical protein J6590_057834 [Homalodisca vitripennis]
MAVAIFVMNISFKHDVNTTLVAVRLPNPESRCTCPKVKPSRCAHFYPRFSFLETKNVCNLNLLQCMSLPPYHKAK